MDDTIRGLTSEPDTYHFIIQGARVRVPFPVITFEHPSGLSFYDRGGWERRTDRTGCGVDLIVLHWDECTSSLDCFQTLLRRGLSAHLLIDADGTVYQTLDLAEARAWHARAANERSVGIEINNPVQSTERPPGRRMIRETRPHTTSLWEHLDFTPAQKKRIAQLVPALCELLGVPAELPMADDGGVPTGAIDPRFKGVCGHFHLQTDKVDPGLTLWPVLEHILRRSDVRLE